MLKKNETPKENEGDNYMSPFVKASQLEQFHAYDENEIKVLVKAIQECPFDYQPGNDHVTTEETLELVFQDVLSKLQDAETTLES